MYKEKITTPGPELELGEIMSDEMKIQESILYNVSNRKVASLTGDFMCKKKIMKNMLDDNKFDTFCFQPHM